MLRAALCIFGALLAGIGWLIVRAIGARLGPAAEPMHYAFATIGGLFLFFGLGLIIAVWLDRPIPRE